MSEGKCNHRSPLDPGGVGANSVKHDTFARWAIGLVTAVAMTSTQAAYTVSDFILPGAVTTSVWGVNNSGVIAGRAGDGTSAWGFIYDGNSALRLDGPPGGTDGGGVIGLSDTGLAIGSWALGEVRAGPYLYSAGVYSMTDFAIAGASATFFRGISPNGHYLSGYYTKAGGGAGGFVYDLNSMSLLALIDPGASTLIAHGVNNAGQVVGNYTVTGPGAFCCSAFVYDTVSGVRTDFRFSGVSTLAPRGINAAGQMAGFLRLDSSPTIDRPWVGDANGYQLIDVGNRRAVAEGINDLGQVVGFYNDGAVSQTPGFIATPVPEPAAAGMLLAGLAGLAGKLAWRRRSALSRC